MARRFEGKVAVVTGSTQGIGAETALRLADEGAAVTVCGRTVEKGEKIAAQIRDRGGRAIFVPLDMADEQQAINVFEQTAKAFGLVTVLINNAVLGRQGHVDTRIHEVTTENFDRIIRTNVDGLYFCTREGIKQMLKAGGGAIVNISSIVSVRAIEGFPAYTMAKGAMNALTRNIAVEYGPSNIRCNTIITGTIMTGAISQYGDPLDARQRQMMQGQPLQILGQPDDMAATIAFLASHEAKFITGTEVVVDGGKWGRLQLDISMLKEG